MRTGNAYDIVADMFCLKQSNNSSNSDSNHLEDTPTEINLENIESRHDSSATDQSPKAPPAELSPRRYRIALAQ